MTFGMILVNSVTGAGENWGDPRNTNGTPASSCGRQSQLERIKPTESFTGLAQNQVLSGWAQGAFATKGAAELKQPTSPLRFAGHLG